jgi:hypothetical protein
MGTGRMSLGERQDTVAGKLYHNAGGHASSQHQAAGEVQSPGGTLRAEGDQADRLLHIQALITAEREGYYA